MDVEILHAVAKLDQDTSGSGLDEFVHGDAVGGDAVDLVRFECGDLRFRRTERCDLDAVVAPALGTG